MRAILSRFAILFLHKTGKGEEQVITSSTRISADQAASMEGNGGGISSLDTSSDIGVRARKQETEMVSER